MAQVSPPVNTRCCQDSLSEWSCLHYKELPEWLQDNEFILKGYRPPLKSVRQCVKSVLRVHTETGNIWTHLVPCLLYFFLGVHWFFNRGHSEDIKLEEKIVFAVYFCGHVACFGFSTTYHTLCCHSKDMGMMCCKLDYIGINLIIMSSFYIFIYYCFQCEETIKNGYYTMTAILGSSSLVMSAFSRFSHQDCRTLRATVFALYGVSGVIPVIHYAVLNGYLHAQTYASVGWIGLVAFFYASGGMVYASRLPERLFPGKFDIAFNSHQLFHVLVWAAAFTYYFVVMKIVNHRELHLCCGNENKSCSVGSSMQRSDVLEDVWKWKNLPSTEL